MAKQSGFKDISCDLIFGIPQIGEEPGETFEELQEDLERVTEWGAMHVSAYSIIVEDNTPLNTYFQKKQAQEIDGGLERQMYYSIRKYLKKKNLSI